jgi:hypothetical protein
MYILGPRSQGASGDRKRSRSPRTKRARALASDILLFCYAVSGVAAGRRVWGLQWTAQPFTNSSRKSAALRRNSPQPSKRLRHSRLNWRSKNTEPSSIPHCKGRYGPYRSVPADGCRQQTRDGDDDSVHRAVPFTPLGRGRPTRRHACRSDRRHCRQSRPRSEWPARPRG